MKKIGVLKNKSSIKLVGVILLILGIILPIFNVSVFSIDSLINVAIVYADESPPSIESSTIAGTEDDPTIIELTTVDIILEIDDGDEGSGIESFTCRISGYNYEEVLNLFLVDKVGGLEQWGVIWDVPTLEEETKVKLVYTATDKSNHTTEAFSYALISENIVDEEDVTSSSPSGGVAPTTDDDDEIIDDVRIIIPKDKIIRVPKPLEFFNILTFLGMTMIIGTRKVF